MNKASVSHREYLEAGLLGRRKSKNRDVVAKTCYRHFREMGKEKW